MVTYLRLLLQRLFVKLKEKYLIIRDGKTNMFALQFRLSIGYSALEGCHVHPPLVLGLFALTLLATLHHLLICALIFGITPFSRLLG